MSFLLAILIATKGGDWGKIVKAEIFTSTEQMTLLVKTHAQVTRYLKEFLISQYKQLDEAGKWVLFIFGILFGFEYIKKYMNFDLKNSKWIWITRRWVKRGPGKFYRKSRQFFFANQKAH